MNQQGPSELDLIEWIRRSDQKIPSSVIRHIGDDCTVFHPSLSSSTMVTTDALLEDVHFRRRWISAYFLGKKSLLVNLSDLSAMGCHPYGCLLSLALPPSLTGDYFRGFMEGFFAASRYGGLPLLGGDLARNEKIIVNVTAWGFSNLKQKAVLRSGAKNGDLLVVVGDLGLSRLGLEILRQEDPPSLWQVSNEEALAAWAGDGFRFRCIKAHFLPPALIGVGNWLGEHELANAMIDVSDGLASDLFRIANESNLEAEIEVDSLVLPERGVGKLQPLQAVINGGEDYALLFTASKQQLERLRSTYPDEFPAYQVIGRVYDGPPAVYLKHRGGRSEYKTDGFDHFRGAR